MAPFISTHSRHNAIMVTTNTDSNNSEAYKSTQYLLRRITPRGLYYKARTFSRQYRLLFLPFARWRWTKWRETYKPALGAAVSQPLSKDSEIVIEGFPRTANTFAQVAFELAQANPVKVAHHTHAAAQVIAGVHQQIPVILLIRQPEDAILSYLIGNFDPDISMKQVILDYISFYKPVVPYRDKVVVATFEQLTTDYAAIIRRVNQQFGTDYNVFESTAENTERCFQVIEEGTRTTFQTVKESNISRPSDSRRAYKEMLSEEYHGPALSRYVNKAQAVYDRLVIE
ncbi:MAG: hypothetical protein AAFY72_07815 [Cyanobacteria bacterium J06649_4]